MDTAREMIKESLPIKCLEAVIVGLYPFCNFRKCAFSKKNENKFGTLTH